MIKDETKRCGEIVKNLLLFAKKDFGKWTEESLHKILQISIALVRHNLEMKELELVQEFGEGDDILYCDASGIQHVFVALFMNAIEAMSKGGRLRIKTDPGFSQEGVLVTVSDTGCGIPPDILPNIFEPFFSTKESTGLGLAVVYRIVRQHEGRVEVESKLNEGTTFRIYLPRRPSRAHQANDQETAGLGILL